jgi:hypothetical protein
MPAFSTVVCLFFILVISFVLVMSCIMVLPLLSSFVNWVKITLGFSPGHIFSLGDVLLPLLPPLQIRSRPDQDNHKTH